VKARSWQSSALHARSGRSSASAPREPPSTVAINCRSLLLVPILAGLAGLLNSFRMVRLPDPTPSGSGEGMTLGYPLHLGSPMIAAERARRSHTASPHREDPASPPWPRSSCARELCQENMRPGMLQVPESKIAIPELPDPFVPRRALLAELAGDDPADRRVTLVCAPGGYGKTTLLAHWALVAGRIGPPPAWVNLDRDDDDPHQLWNGVVAALTAHPAVPADGPLRELAESAASVGDPAGPAFVADLVDALDGLAVRVPLVLHNVHEVRAPGALRALAAMVAARPSSLRLVLSSRLDPPLPLATLRSGARLREFRADRLRFSVDEAGDVLERQGLRLGPAQIRQLHACTGGWPTAVHLTGVVLCGGADPDAFLARFADDTRPVADFLVGEVLGSLADPDRELLVAASTDAPLVDEPEAREGLERLARMTGLVTPMPRRLHGYLVDPLVAAHLRTGRGRRSPSTAGARDRTIGSGRGEDDLRWMSAYAALQRSEPIEARRIAAQALRDGTALRQTRAALVLRTVHGAALFDCGSRHRGLQEMGETRTELGAVPLAGDQAAVLAVLEHRAALALGRPDLALTVADWLAQRSDTAGELLLMRAWAALSTGRDQIARTAVRPLLDGSVTGLLPHTVVEAFLVETTAAVTAGEVYAARGALRTALSLGAPLDAVRPFAMAEPPARLLLSRKRTIEPFVARALVAGRGARPRPTMPLTDAELAMVELLPSPMSVEQIAAELDIASSDEAHRMMRTVYRKLGVSSRRTAVTTAFERRLLR
jgi:DNA-binding NarL/FixJ family response regulator